MDRATICDRFLDTIEYDLYPFQEEALLAWFDASPSANDPSSTGGSPAEGGLLVSAPTGMGKTLIAEAALFEALTTGRHLYYTTPLIALTDQKFREFQDAAERWGFDRNQIGLVTGNRRVNPDALIRVVVAEILLNHLIANDEQLLNVTAVVMDEFHYFNDRERGIVWELSLVLLPSHVRLLLLSATVGNAGEFVRWAATEHGRRLTLIQTDERRVPLEFNWVGDKLLTEHLPQMIAADDAANRTPALVFCFNRDACWGVAERLKGVTLIDQATRASIETHLANYDLSNGAGIKLKQLLIRGVGVHHAGILPKYKELVEKLFLEKLIPLVICTETLAAGINLPARSVVINTLLHGKPGERKLIAPSSAHQMFGRAGRPQFDSHGYVYAMAPEDDVKIVKWKKKYDQIDPKSKDPGIMRAKKALERKKPSRRSTEQYWSEGQFNTLINAKPANLFSRSMIPYHVLIYLLTKSGTLRDVRTFLAKRFNSQERNAKFGDQLDYMLSNLAQFGYVTHDKEDDLVSLHESIYDLLVFRSVDPLLGAFLARQLVISSHEEKLQVLEAILPLPPAMLTSLRLPELQPGPLQTQSLEPTLIKMGIALAHADGGVFAPRDDDDEGDDYYEEEEPPPRLSLPEMLAALFEAKLAAPEFIQLRGKWVAGGLAEYNGDFYKFVRARDLIKNEGLVLRHLLRLVILAGEFHAQSGEDPDYELIRDAATEVCQQVDPSYTDRFLASQEEAKKLMPL